MAKSLVIVESPAKVKTISKYLGNNYSVVASYGHVRELSHKKDIAIQFKFKLHYRYIKKNACHVEKIKKEAKKATSIFLALDPDREGEAISWHIQEILNGLKDIKREKIWRISFCEITQDSVKNAIKNPRKICMDLVNAQQARCVLDLLVGFSLSPLLWKKIKAGLSAGRVQSPAMQLVIDRNKEILNFKIREYWKIKAKILTGGREIFADLVEHRKKRLGKFSLLNRDYVNTILDDIYQEKILFLGETKKIKRRIASKPPFTTSTLQQESFSRLNFSTKTTMNIAQQLYEGIKISDSCIIGLITYMRTDSVTMSELATASIRKYIESNYGSNSIKSSFSGHVKKIKNAQEAHEAIRPTDIEKTPTVIGRALTDKQFKLYNLIWKRAVASQMRDKEYFISKTDFQARHSVFRTKFSFVYEKGFSRIYDKDCKQSDVLKNTEAGKFFFDETNAVIKDVYSKQYYAEPPSELTEGDIIGSLEKLGIGRPSTYSPIISTLKNRNYVNAQNRFFSPTDTAFIVSKLLVRYFPNYIDYIFTADLERKLDEISHGSSSWITVVKDFWGDFSKRFSNADKILSKETIGKIKIDSRCRLCQMNLVIRFGAFGRFISCSGYPFCSYVKKINTKKFHERSIHCKECESAILRRF